MSDLQLELITLADYASLSQERKLTVAGIFDRIFVESVPINWPRMFVVAVVKGKPNSNHRIELSISSITGGEKVLERAIEIRLGDGGKANLITQLINFPLKWVGEYRISLKGKEEVGNFTFVVIKRKADGREKEDLPN